ncbi:MAG: phosphate starvation-inducible protein PhoH [candidate division Zixibacteria bacterium HGW-Zixibacteria-1]|nr:MAG: phosphate starvation-inducible protein PhoH [candidate division Zixibacteria bacterium HGW-Zixibacteria-1]
MQSKSLEKISQTYMIEDIDPRLVFGQNDIYLRMIEKSFVASIVARGNKIIVEGGQDEVRQIIDLIEDLVTRVRHGNYITEQYLNYSMEMVREGQGGPASIIDDVQTLAHLKREVRPKTVGQKLYLNTINDNDIVFSIGPAGTGKTYLAVAVAVAALKNKRVNRIVLVRPAVEAGESLGFLPGDIRAKVDPYLRPVYDALHEMMQAEKIKKLIDLGIIEIVPLAFMRGRTLNNTFVILDEAQNTTPAQMKMFLTRLGEGSQAVITGDITQIDLDENKSSGLVVIQKILKDVSGIEFVYLTDKDVVRHPLVQKIIRAYEKYEKKRRKG